MLMEPSQLCTTETVENGRVLIVTLNNPPDNTMSPEMFRALGEAVDAWTAEGGPDLAIFTGGGRVFSKGFDVGVIRSYADHAAHETSLLLTNDVCTRIAQSPKPAIAAINGPCFGGGLELALACHIRLCAEKARLGLPEVWRGLIPAMGGIHRLVRLVGSAKTLELVALGDLVTAEEAHRVGLVNRVLSRTDFMERVLSFARGILMADQALVREIVRLIAAAPVKDDQQNIIETIDAAVRLWASARH